MKHFFRTLFTFAVVAFAVVAFNTIEADALTITETDFLGNERVLLDIDPDDLAAPFIMPLTDEALPHPDRMGMWIPDLGETIIDYQIPNACSFILIDLGPNWEDLPTASGEDSNVIAEGRYMYIFYGLYNPVYGFVHTGGELQHRGYDSYDFYGSDSIHPDERVLTIYGPYATVFYNDETGKAYLQCNEYPEGYIMGGAHYLTFEGLTSWNDIYYSDYYPRVKCYSDEVIQDQGLILGSDTLYTTIDDLTWDRTWEDDYSESGTENRDDWLDLILSGHYSAESPILQFFADAIISLSAVIEFFQDAPAHFDSLFSIFPPLFAEFMKVCVTVIFTMVLVKFAIGLFT